MITATIGKNYPHTVKVHGLVNRGGWFGQTWLLSVSMGFESLNFVVEAGNEDDVISEFTDSRYGHLIIIEDFEKQVEAGDIDPDDFSDYYGNTGIPVDLDCVNLWPCKVNYFAKREDI